MKLNQLKKEQIGIITNILDSPISIVILERGFYVGQKIKLYQSDIFDSVKIFDIGTLFMLRKEEAELVEIELLN
jgi:Fe2+ transport system protein FeoA